MKHWQNWWGKSILVCAVTLLSGLQGAWASPSLSENGKNWTLRSQGYEVAVSKTTGAIERIRLLEPTPYDLMPEKGTSRIWLTLYKRLPALDGVTDFNPPWTAYADHLTKAVQERGRDFVVVTCDLDTSDVRIARLVKMRARYTLYDDRLEVKVNFKFNWGLGERCQMGVGSPWQASDWEKYNTMQLTYPATHNGLFRFADFFDDAQSHAIGFFQSLTYHPEITAWRPDRYLMWGSFDFGKPLVMAVNRDGLSPCFLRTPIMTKPDQEFELSYFLAAFPRPQQTLTDVTVWYMRHAMSSVPITRDLVTMPKDLPHRTMGYGNLRSNQHLAPTLAEQRGFLDFCKKTRQLSFWWYGGEKRWDDTYPLNGEEPWACEPGGPLGYRYTPELMRKLIKDVQAEGFRPFIYFRQFHFYGHTPHEAEGKPPYMEWSLPSLDGGLQVYFHDYWNRDYEWNEDEKQWYGIKAEHADKWIPMGDFCLPEFRDWYIRNLKAVIDYYRPAGIAFDMNWDVGGRVCARHPDIGFQHGELRVFADVYKWLKKIYPEMRVVMNVGGVPTVAIMYADAVMAEGGFRADSSAEDMWAMAERFRAYRVNFFSLDYTADIIGVMRAFGMGMSWSDNGMAPGAESGQPVEKGYYYLAREYKHPLMKLVSGPFAEFSAQTYAVPIVCESHAVEITPGPLQCFASAWADKQHLLVTAWNDTDQGQKVTIRMDPKILAQYGQSGRQRLEFMVVGPDGEARKDSSFQQTAPFTLEGTLPAKHLLFAQ